MLAADIGPGPGKTEPQVPGVLCPSVLTLFLCQELEWRKSLSFLHPSPAQALQLRYRATVFTLALGVHVLEPSSIGVLLPHPIKGAAVSVARDLWFSPQSLR